MNRKVEEDDLDINNDLHLSSTGNCFLDGAGTTVSTTVDIDNQTRSNPPDIGADEFISVANSLSMKLYIEGYYTGSGAMNAFLYNLGMSADSNDCENVIVELHHPNTLYGLFYSTPSVLKKNGAIFCTLPCNAVFNSYYVVVKTRNAVETWSKLPVTIGGVTNFDFSD